MCKERTSHKLQNMEGLIKLAQKMRKVLLILLIGRPISGSSTRGSCQIHTSSGVEIPQVEGAGAFEGLQDCEHQLYYFILFIYFFWS